ARRRAYAARLLHAGPRRVRHLLGRRHPGAGGLFGRVRCPLRRRCRQPGRDSRRTGGPRRGGRGSADARRCGHREGGRAGGGFL
ncbi:MAG: hypothetical protein AVDCRST_MAG55-3179, partial [uncultured Rubrobacteraceae bacterium]